MRLLISGEIPAGRYFSRIAEMSALPSAQNRPTSSQISPRDLHTITLAAAASSSGTLPTTLFGGQK